MKNKKRDNEIKRLRSQGWELKRIAKKYGLTVSRISYILSPDKHRAYGQTEKYKAYHKAYRKTEKSKAYQKAYKQTEKYKAYQKAYGQTEKYKAYQKAYKQTEKYKAYRRAYQKKTRVDSGKDKDGK